MADKSDVYLETVKRLEPDIAMIDAGAGFASIAISLKRIADVLERREFANVRGEDLAAILRSIKDTRSSDERQYFLTDLANAVETGRIIRYTGDTTFIWSVGDVGK